MGQALPATQDLTPQPDCTHCGRTWGRHALYYLPATGQFIGWRTCDAIDAIDDRRPPVTTRARLLRWLETRDGDRVAAHFNSGMPQDDINRRYAGRLIWRNRLERLLFLGRDGNPW